MKTFESYLLDEMARSLKSGKAYVKAHAMPLAEHWIKTELMPKHNSNKHWHKEINGWIKGINSIKVKTDKGRIPKDEIIDIIIKNIDLSEEIDSVIEDYNILNPNLSKVTSKKLKEFLLGKIK